jgi:aminocarboxymuconate-semialdehyde decarboxylase
LPFLISRITRKSSDEVALGLKSMYYDTVSGSPDAVKCACHVFGPSHLLFGTDYPYCDEREFARHLDYLDECDLDAPSLEGVRGTNAATLFSNA